MHGLPDDFDGKFFLGSTLEQICLTVNTMSLHFDHDIMVTIEGEYSCRITDSTEATSYHVPKFDLEVMRLLEQAVTAVAGSRDGMLELTFANGYRLAIYDNPHYEAYHIRHRDSEITV